jgi:hypothetical protein
MLISFSSKKKPEDGLEFKDYAPFIVNRSLSYHMDCVLYANEINLHSGYRQRHAIPVISK